MTLQLISQERRKSIMEKLNLLYGDQDETVYRNMERLLENYRKDRPMLKPWVSEDDVMLITYGDTVKENDKAPLQTLHHFLTQYVKETISAVHILPFYPYTSDDGFSVVDYREIDPELGKWEHVNSLSRDFDLMFDAVINHISQSSEWFQGYLRGEEKYKSYFTEADPNADYGQVTRPRALPLLTRFETAKGTKHIWTTFSSDQIDLNFKNPDVLLEILDILLEYAANGARFIRLDAIGFAWKKLGTTCMHLEETHALVKLMRNVLDLAAPGTIMITETNVPHIDNISYFGNGYDEAQMVYQFPLPPLTLYSFHTKNASKLLQWADSLDPTSDSTTFFNFLASHDGIGMRPIEGILNDDEKQMMTDKTLAHGGRVSYKDNGDGTKSAYELNINYLDALTHPDESDDIRIGRFLGAQTILLSVAGVPGIYIHSLLGSRNDYKGLEESGINRRINREKLDKHELVNQLETDTLRRTVFQRFSRLIKIRRRQKAFNPQALEQVMFLDERVFSILRKNEQSGDEVLVLVNVSDETVTLLLPFTGMDLIGEQHTDANVQLNPYQCMWVKK
ncbi:sugar phosphorylase [Cohnella luojiensis]|uniref:Sucrose phosphorylase n=1 Tax=Cohnella luojiensis TaxID=652876 RepID=A0A4Y8M403_9BACL|nr:sugar phosphorylase [Cohnella luojiensis]TFE29510.1 sugar phosphorylase [Cohnella luojiensis]